MARMIGKSCPQGPGGRDCYCCGQAPGTKRKKMRRSVKRGKANNAWKNNTNKED